MNRRRALLLAVFVYVGLDLSLPAMPGAFMFDPDGSVESVQGSCARARATDLVAVPAEASGVVVLSHPPADLARRLVQVSRVEARGRPVRVRPFPAHVDPAPGPEDPH